MKIKVLYMSDLHLEMEKWRPLPPLWHRAVSHFRGHAPHPVRGPVLEHVGAVDLVILAGDIHNGVRGVAYADQVAKYLAAPVVLIAGNHEFYHHDMAHLIPALRKEVARTQGRVQFLQNDVADFKIKGQTISVLGCSLWTDFRLDGDEPAAMQRAQKLMNDYNFIRLNRALLTPRDAQGFHAASLLWLHATLRLMQSSGKGGKAIIATHHAPTGQVLGIRKGPIAPAYGSEIIEQFKAAAPVLWVHGHTHVTHDSVIEGIRLVSASRGYPKGYPGDAYKKFHPGLVEI